jgi:hypothetical protein
MTNQSKSRREMLEAAEERLFPIIHEIRTREHGAATQREVERDGFKFTIFPPVVVKPTVTWGLNYRYDVRYGPAKFPVFVELGLDRFHIDVEIIDPKSPLYRAVQTEIRAHIVAKIIDEALCSEAVETNTIGPPT